ncbi:MAG: hypothetical protein VX519_00375 [Myxococcota bacterium]|nr:hypothetical protein [Myxococcota bacterium]
MTVHVYRWDLDKTYLETDFDSVRSLVRTALEPAVAKRAVPGARALLGALCSRPENRIAILSGSPTQMRRVLSEKLSLDGIRFDELKLKDNLGNLKRGRVRALREQVGYKLPALLNGRYGVEDGALEVLFGDDAEVDALVYAVYADVLAGRLGTIELRRFMVAAGAYEDQVERAVAAQERLTKVDAVERIFIHLDRGLPVSRFHALGQRVVPIQSWFQAALVLAAVGQLEPVQVGAVAGDVMAGADMGAAHLANLAQDVVRRGHVASDQVLSLVSTCPAFEGALEEEITKRLIILDKTVSRLVPFAGGLPDYVGLVKSWAHRR